MTATPLPAPMPARRLSVVSAVSVAAFALIVIGGEMWAKWWPYGHKLASVAGSRVYPGRSVLASAGPPGGAPSFAHAWSFTVAYGRSVWPALAAALLIGAGVQSLVPRSAFTRIFARRGARGSLYGTLASLPSLMCTCCGAPVTNSLRRSGASPSAALGYWLGNPLLNPAVLAFLALVLPWPFVTTRLLVGTAVAVGASALIGRLAPPTAAVMPAGAPAGQDRRPGGFGRALSFGSALWRLSVVLVPEYFVVVMAMGAFRGWLLPLGHAATTWGLAAVLVAAAAGTLLVVPTGAEIPVIVGLISAGFAAGVTGAVLIALPAVSLPSMIMVGRDLSWRVVAATAGAVLIAALAGAGLLTALL